MQVEQTKEKEKRDVTNEENKEEKNGTKIIN